MRERRWCRPWLRVCVWEAEGGRVGVCVVACSRLECVEGEVEALRAVGRDAGMLVTRDFWGFPGQWVAGERELIRDVGGRGSSRSSLCVNMPCGLNVSL